MTIILYSFFKTIIPTIVYFFINEHYFYEMKQPDKWEDDIHILN
jgi:hypothetical protein